MSLAQLPDRLAARAASFSLIGVANGLVGIGVIVIAGLLGADPIAANVAGYAAGLVVSFTLNSRITFRDRTRDVACIARFLAAFGLAFAANLAVVAAVARFTPVQGILASLAGTPLYVVVFYLLCEYWVFRRPQPDAPESRPPAP